MVLEVQRLSQRFRDAGFTAEANVLAAQADIFRAAGTPEVFPENVGTVVDVVDFPFKYDKKDVVELNGDVINTLRTEELGLTQEELAERTRLGKRKPIAHSTISQVEAGKITQMTRFNAARIARGLGVGLVDILKINNQQEE